MKPVLSIIIPTLNEEKYLPKLLKSIGQQSFKYYEIIVADYNSKDSTMKIAKKFGCRITNGGKPSVGRNNGAKIAKADILLFLDADIVLPRNFLNEVLYKFKVKRLDIASCFMIPDSNNLVDNVLFFSANIFSWIFQFFSPFAIGSCLIVKKQFHNRINGFDETLFPGEDFDYVKKINKFGKFRIVTPYVMNSVRRFEKEGRIKLIVKAVYFTLYRTFKGEVGKEIFDYESGNFG